MRKQRRSIRLKGYNYTQQSAYFTTMCCHQRICLFGHIIQEAMRLNTWGQIVYDEWKKTALLRPYIELDEFVVMPNHFHGIIAVVDAPDANIDSIHLQRQFGQHLAHSIPTIIGMFKAAVTRNIHLQDSASPVIWQRNYHEHIIRNQHELDRLRAYVETNPARWYEDSLHSGK